MGSFGEILFLSLMNVKFFAMAGHGRSKYLLTAKINYIIFSPTNGLK